MANENNPKESTDKVKSEINSQDKGGTNTKWVVILIVLILGLFILAMGWYWYYKTVADQGTASKNPINSPPEVVSGLEGGRCIDSINQCIDKPDGTSCTYGIWCDEAGKPCGGECEILIPGQCLTQFCLMSLNNNDEADYKNSYKYDNFSLKYPDGWQLVEMSKSDNFPLKNRLTPVYPTGNIFALNKDDFYLIFAIDPVAKEGVSGTFNDDVAFNDFVENHNALKIQNKLYFLSQFHYGISDLETVQSVPANWTALSEYDPKTVVNNQGDTVRSRSETVKMNGYSYDVFLVASEKGMNSAELQREILGILETVRW